MNIQKYITGMHGKEALQDEGSLRTGHKHLSL